MESKKLYLATFGCQMNEYDSQRMTQLLSRDYLVTDRPEEAALILINTCSIREKAEHKVYSLAGRFKGLKESRPDLIIGICGCVAQQEGGRLLKRLPHLDLVFGPHALHTLNGMIEEIKNGMGPICRVEQNTDFYMPALSLPLPQQKPVRTYLTIMQGCDNFCTYCVVPYVRGREMSRPIDDILSEARLAISQGVKEIILLGQNVNSYGKKTNGLPNFAQLLKKVSELDRLERLRFTTSHPKDLSEDVINSFAMLSNLCEHLHLPVQSGSTSVLKRMNRRYTRDEYLSKIDLLKKTCPDITLTTDILVGFPGETEQDFEDTLSLLNYVEFEQIFAFKYSPRPFTRAARFEDQVPEETKAKRLDMVLKLQNEISLKRHKKLEGKVVEVLVEGQSKGDLQELAGKTRGNHVVNFPGPRSLIGNLELVKIETACYHSLRGTLNKE